ncbi:DUF4870 domain-containing protein [Patescibacteria group bacterium]
MVANDDRNMQAALSYVLLFVSGIYYLITNKDPYVRFHAMQSVVVFGALTLLIFLLGFTVVLATLSSLVAILMFTLWLILIYKAWNGEAWEVPVLGEFARRWANKV